MVAERESSRNEREAAHAKGKHERLEKEVVLAGTPCSALLTPNPNTWQVGLQKAAWEEAMEEIVRLQVMGLGLVQCTVREG